MLGAGAPPAMADSAFQAVGGRRCGCCGGPGRRCRCAPGAAPPAASSASESEGGCGGAAAVKDGPMRGTTLPAAGRGADVALPPSDPPLRMSRVASTSTTRRQNGSRAILIRQEVILKKAYLVEDSLTCRPRRLAGCADKGHPEPGAIS